MNYQDPPLHGQAKNITYDYESPAKIDARLQADPELASSEGRATLPAIAIYFTAMVFVVCVVLWGLNHQRDETVTNASAPATEAPANTGQAPQQQGNTPARQQQGNNAANPPPKQQSQDQQPPAQPQQNAEKPAQQNAPANAQQQNTPAPKQQ